MAVNAQRYNIEAPFMYPEQAIKFAYRVESQDVVKVSSYFRQLRGGTVKLRRSSSDPYDQHAQAAMVLIFIEKRLPKREQIILQGRYTVPSANWLERRKIMDMLLISEIAMEECGSRIPKHYVEDCVRKWVGFRPHHQDNWWAKHFGVTPWTLWHWRTRGKGGKTGFMSVIERYHHNAIERLNEPMYEAGLTSI